MRLFQKQFLIAKQNYAFDDTWRHINLPEGWILSFQELLNYRHEAPEPDADMTIGDRYSWCDGEGEAGRYVRLRYPHVTIDPCGLLGVFFGGHGENICVGSSAELVAAFLAGRPHPEPDTVIDLEHRAFMNYIPAPGTRWRAVRRLLSDQAFDLRKGEVVAIDDGISPLSDFNTAVDVVAEELCNFASALGQRVDGVIDVKLTAGYDSRTLVAAFAAAGVPFRTSTLDFVGKPKSDIDHARKISKVLGVPHVIQTPLDSAPELRSLVDRHVSGSLTDWATTHMIPGMIDSDLSESDAIVVGHCFEVGYPQTSVFLERVNFSDASGMDIVKALWRDRHYRSEDAFAKMLDDWLNWRREHPRQMEWSSCFYLDQRLGAWKSSEDHAFDVLRPPRVTPANNRKILSAMITPNFSERREKRLQIEVIRRLAPRLLRYSFNPVDVSLSKRVRRKVRGAGKRLLSSFQLVR